MTLPSLSPCPSLVRIARSCSDFRKVIPRHAIPRGPCCTPVSNLGHLVINTDRGQARQPCFVVPLVGSSPPGLSLSSHREAIQVMSELLMEQCTREPQDTHAAWWDLLS